MAISLLLVAGGTTAAEIVAFSLDPEGQGYRLKASSLIDASIDGVREVLTDYGRLHLISHRIIESELVGVSPEGVSHVRTRNRLCFLVLCRDLGHLQHIREINHGEFESHSVPEESDLAFGHARWRLSEEGEGSRLDIDFRFAMNSYDWAPSWVTRVVARSVLKADAAALVQGIERAVRLREGKAGGR
jgi:hypothetical protein